MFVIEKPPELCFWYVLSLVIKWYLAIIVHNTIHVYKCMVTYLCPLHAGWLYHHIGVSYVDMPHNERKCEQACIPHALTLLESAAYNEC